MLGGRHEAGALQSLSTESGTIAAASSRRGSLFPRCRSTIPRRTGHDGRTYTDGEQRITSQEKR